MKIKRKPVKKILKNAKGQFLPGTKGGGRKKGSLNKDTKGFISLKQSFLDAFNDPRIGGTEGLISWVVEHPSRLKVFYGWIVRLLPRQVDMGVPEDEGAQKLLEKYKDLDADDLKKKLRELAQSVTRTVGA